MKKKRSRWRRRIGRIPSFEIASESNGRFGQGRSINGWNMRVSINKVSKSFGDSLGVNAVSFDIEDQEFFFLVAPSGWGKPPLRRLLAGFYHRDGGDIGLGARRMNGVPPHL